MDFRATFCSLFFIFFAHHVSARSVPMNSGPSLRSLINWEVVNSLSLLEKRSFIQKLLSTPYTPPAIAAANCTKVERCDSTGACSIVCQRGTLQFDSWLDNAIRSQLVLSRKLPFCYSQLPGSHNSAISFADGYGNEDHVFQELMKYISWIDPSARVQTNDQWFSLTDQLNMGLRMIELDTHWVDNELRIAHCGGLHVSPEFQKFIDDINEIAKLFNISWDVDTIGCSPSLSSIPAREQRSLLSAFQEIHAWMVDPKNLNEFLVIYFDDDPDLKEWGKVSLLVSLIEEVFGSTAFTPLDKMKYAPDWNISMETMINSLGKRTLFLSGSDYGDQMNSTIFSMHGSILCNFSQPCFGCFQPYPNCTFGPGQSTNRGVIIRQETSEIQYGPIDGGGHWGPGGEGLDEKTIPAHVKCNINYLSPDCLTPARVKAMVWSWAEGNPSSSSSCTTIETSLEGRWISRPCPASPSPSASFFPLSSASFSYACQSLDPTFPRWEFSATSTCPDGFNFSPPFHPLANQRLVDAMVNSGLTSVWINI